MSADVFVKQAILNGEKALSLLDADDREAVNLMISAKEQESYESGKRENSQVYQCAGEIGCGSFLAVFIVLCAFFLSRPEGWPICDLPHKQSLQWWKYCTNSDGVPEHLCTSLDDVSKAKVVYKAYLDEWECEAASAAASDFTCKQSKTLPEQF